MGPGEERDVVDDGQERWCAGLRARALVQLTHEDVAPLLGEVRRRRNGAFALLALAVLAAGVGVGLLVRGPWTDPVVLASARAGFAMTILLSVLALRVFRHARTLGNDLIGGIAFVFRGRIDPGLDDRDLRRFLQRGLLRLDLRREHEVWALPSSGRVLRVDDRVLNKPEWAHIARTAGTQPHAWEIALPKPLVTVHHDDELKVARRALTMAEIAEIRRWTARFRGRFVASIVASVAIAALVVAVLLAMKAFLVVGVVLVGVLLAGLGSWISYGVWMRVTRDLEHDVELRWVITVRDRERAARARHGGPSTGDDGAPAHGESSIEPNTPPREPAPPRFEVLPISRLMWTESERPASWRFSRG